MPDETVVLPGHGGQTTIGRERATNPFLREAEQDSVPQPPPMQVTGATLDRFVLWISATDPKWQPDAAQMFVRSLGADAVRLVNVEGGADA